MLNNTMLAGVTLVLATLGLGQGAYALSSDNFSVQVGAESFYWREFDAGLRLLEEKGARLRVGVGLDNFQRVDSGFLYGMDGAVHLGRVDYDGQACSVVNPAQCVPYKSDTDYFGLELEGLGGFRFAQAKHGVEIFGGMGVDSWLRKIKAGDGVAGAKEEYFVLNSKFGAGFFHRLDSWSYHLQAGIKYPFYVYEYVLQDTADDLDLSPRGRASGFANFRVNLAPRARNPVSLIVYYDSYRFAESDLELQTVNGAPLVIAGNTYYARQPESRQDVFGIQLAIQFR